MGKIYMRWHSAILKIEVGVLEGVGVKQNSSRGDMMIVCSIGQSVSMGVIVLIIIVGAVLVITV